MAGNFQKEIPETRKVDETDRLDAFLKSFLYEINISVEEVRHTHCRQNWRAERYTPYFSSIGFILDGEGWIKADEAELLPVKGQMYLLPAGSLQSFSTINANPYDKYYCHFCAKAGNTSIFDVLRLPLCVNVKEGEKTKEIYRQLLESFNRADALSLINTKALVLQLILRYIESCDPEEVTVPGKTSNLNMIKAVNYIDKNYRQDLQVKKIAEMSNYHPCYFTKLFKETFNSSPVQYITRIRVEKSKKLLIATDRSISQIADEVGFNSPFYFASKFKSHTGLTPSEYRNAYHIST
jgi:AraC-like DNA-binding protein